MVQVMRLEPSSKEGRTTAFMKDNEGRAPFDRLCEKGFDAMLFLNDTSFGGLMMWWYDCLYITFFARDANSIKREMHD